MLRLNSMASCTWHHKIFSILSWNKNQDVSRLADIVNPLKLQTFWNFVGFSARLKRRTLTLDDINKMKDSTPPLKKGSSKMFRNQRDKGIISYTEYLFLLSVLTSKFIQNYFLFQILLNEKHCFYILEPKSGFQIAFNMFDTDGNQRVDKNEFLVVSKSLLLLQ